MLFTFAALRKASMARMPHFRNAKGELTHPPQGGNDWSKLDWQIAVLGELGETANIVKKLRRGDFSLEQCWQELSDELADTLVYTDILANQCGCCIEDLTPDSSASLGPQRDEMVQRRLMAIAHCLCAVDIESKSEQSKIHNQTIFQRMSYLLFSVAASLDIDLGIATISKFNQVSDRIGCDVYMED